VEWLRRQGRRVDAREQLRTACDLLDDMGMDAFAGRARRELLATGETARKRATSPEGASAALTVQEAQVARLARDGLSNLEIGARLFISPRTVQTESGPERRAQWNRMSRRRHLTPLPSDEASFIQGALLPVDGGRIAV
jgi:hypothetical protein